MFNTITPAFWHLHVCSAHRWTTAACVLRCHMSFSVVLLTQHHWLTVSSKTTFSVQHPSICSTTPQPTSSLFQKPPQLSCLTSLPPLKEGLARLSWKTTCKNLSKINRQAEADPLISEHSEYHLSVKQFSTALETPCAAHLKHSLELLTCTSGYFPREKPKQG